MSEEDRAVMALLDDTFRVLRRLRVLQQRERDEWRAHWAPVTAFLYERDAARIAGKRQREALRHAA